MLRGHQPRGGATGRPTSPLREPLTLLFLEGLHQLLQGPYLPILRQQDVGEGRRGRAGLVVPRAQGSPFQKERSRIFTSVEALGSSEPLPLPPFGTDTASKMTFVVPLRWEKGEPECPSTEQPLLPPSQRSMGLAQLWRRPLASQETGTQDSPRPLLALKLGSSWREMVLEPLLSGLLQ